MHKPTEEKKEEAKKEKQEKKSEKKQIILTEAEYAQLKEQAEKSQEQEDKILRLQADFDNIRKRLEREKQEFVRFANEGLIVDLLNIVDDLERSVELAQGKHEDFSAFLKGIEMILAHLYDLLKKNGLSTIEAKGKTFNPDYHEALLKVESDDFHENAVIEELQKGYLLNNRVIRTAKVKVAQKPEGKSEEPENKEQKLKEG
ncbi:MAG: nucleotide exchange factor GrpE [Candidatus Omnitrophota bacterium]|jgi:molecular chaperone GrpE